MGMYTILRNSQLEVQLTSDYQDNGWYFSGGMAIHEDCNEGSIRNTIFQPEVNKDYTIKLQVAGLESGTLEVYLGSTLFGVIDQAGYYELVGTTADSSGLLFTTGHTNLEITSYQINEGLNEGQTIVYDSYSKMYLGHSSVNGDRMEGYLDDLIVFKNGQPWIQDKNEIRNSFFGQKHPSIVRFYCNVEYNSDKDFYFITLNSTAPWRADIVAPPREGKRNGQRTRVKTRNYRFDKGRYVADILRDMNDPRFDNEMQALLRGAMIQGQYIEVTITNTDDVEVQLESVEIDVSLK